MTSYKRRPTPGNTEWFVRDRFGLFIHFGLYSAIARHEWVKSYECLSDEEYDKHLKYFNPDLFDAREWAKAAKKAGMKYAILTTKHHEGFCMFDSKYTDYKITNTPFGRDLVKEYAEAFRAEGLKVGFYYSLIDWHHPDYIIDCIHPRRKEENVPELDQGKDMKRYNEYMRNQVTELLTNYGKIDVIWFDYTPKTTHPKPNMINGGSKRSEDWEPEKLIPLIRKLMPEIIINNRMGVENDLWTPEQTRPTDWVRHKETGELVTWEACHTMSGPWGYMRESNTHWQKHPKSPEMLIRLLVDTVSYGGNLIMNVGPNGRGLISEEELKDLEIYGKWMKLNGRSIYNCTMAEPEFTAPNGCKLTQSEDSSRLYVHLQVYPFQNVVLENVAPGRVEYAQFLCDGGEILFEEITVEKEGKSIPAVRFKLPVEVPETVDPVIEIFLSEKK